MKQTFRQPKLIAVILLLLVTTLGTFMGYLQLQPPMAPSSSDVNYPAYKRMLENVKTMASEPRTPGSKAIEKTRAHLISQIKSLGLNPIVESHTISRTEVESGNKQMQSPGGQNAPTVAGGGACAGQPQCLEDALYDKNGNVTLKNILVKLDAPDTDKAMLMAAHYDSDPESPGAADDIVSVSAMLEAMRQQAGNKNLKNDLYFLFTDGEELGGMGAKAFVAAHPELTKSLTHIVNLEARGSRGGLIMFETSTHNYNLMHYFTSATSTPIAFSFTAELYKHMPNGTDLTNFLTAGYSGLNFAIGEGIENYHHSSDTFANLDRNSAYQFLLTALEMTSKAAHTEFQDSRQQDGVYFPLLPYNIIVISKTITYLLAGLTLVAASAWLWLGIRRKKLTVRHIVHSSAWLVGTIISVALVSWLVAMVATEILDIEDSSNTVPLFLAQAALYAVATLGVFMFRMRKQTLGQAVAGLLPLQMLFLMVLVIFLYSASYLFILSILVSLAAVLLARNTYVRLIASSIGGFTVLLLFIPVCWIIYVLFMLPASPIALGLGVLPVAILSALFTAEISRNR